MANLDTSETSISMASFSDFPEDVQLCILSFLTPSEISSFACTSKRFLSLCHNDAKLWFSICHRRWGSKTHIRKWGSGRITFKHLYRTLHHYENLIGFWRRSQNQTHGSNSRTTTTNPNSISNPQPPLVFFEWGPSFIVGSRVSPSTSGTYKVVKAPFLWMSISSTGETFNFLEPNSELNLDSDSFPTDYNELISSCENELIPVNVNHMGNCHLVIEENASFGLSRVSSSGDVVTEETLGLDSGSPPYRFTSEMYRYFANRTSPGGDRAWRRQRRRDKERQGKRKWESEHFVKIVNCSPTPSRPLQGLWKGICEDMNLDFYLVAYDDVGGIACRRIGDSSKPFSNFAPVFWTPNTMFIKSPFSPEEKYIYDTREHLRPPGHLVCSEKEAVSSIFYINSSYDLVIPELAGPTAENPGQVEGRIWLYRDGTFGFGFLRNDHIIDLKHVLDGCMLDTTECL